MPALQPPPVNVLMFDPKTGGLSEPWRKFFVDFARVLETGAAPSDAKFVVTTANPELSDEQDLGALSDGFLSIVVALGVATISSSPTIAASVLTGALPALDASALLALNATQLTSGTVPDARFPATLPAVSGVNLTSLTGANINHSVVSKVFADSGYEAANDQTVLVDATGGVTTINLPATPVSGKFVIVKKIDAGANAVTVSGNGNNIDGIGSQSLAAQWNAILVQSDGSDWFIISVV